ncbi:DUF1173 domain-containing protein [Stenotrophomonas oahuensis]|uniref:DUF1173 domain-containing protein n=1 Tax=Stenotrophomonas oahuensis TaxID=3003271 RepID=A0ABY9YW48_9GAMM|nr:DUF1173 domain-containing protein [Stenotrophomonas sp. A5586]WNH54811.1 DUF1173 domain-containing protein [Stenotrophomonas sp. A5586]
MANHFLIDNQPFSTSDRDAQAQLARAYATKKRPACPCTRPPVPMYIAKLEGHYIVKRMPNTGAKHAPVCDSYEPPAALSGLGEVSGAAIQEDTESGITNIKLDFALTKTGARPAPAASGAETASVRTDGKKLTIRGLLHYLWDQAQFNRWSPAMDGRRSWATIHKYLIGAANNKAAKGESLAESLFVPEPYSPDRRAEIDGRRRKILMPLVPSGKARRLMLVVGEVKEIGAARYGGKITIKHMPGTALLINEDLHKRLDKRFASELGLWDTLSESGVRLMLIGTMGQNDGGTYSLHEIALMLVTAQWLPFQTKDEYDLIDAMVRANRRFTVGLRYNLPSDRPLATAVLSDTTPAAVAMYALPIQAGATYFEQLAELVDEAQMPAWFWRQGEALPALPATENYVSMPVPSEDDMATEHADEAESAS